MQIEVKGLDQVAAKFDKLPVAIQDKLKLAMARSLKAIADKARRSHRFKSRTSTLERAIEVEVNNTEGVVRLDPKLEYVPYVHQGTRPHSISPREKRALRWGGVGNWHYAKRVSHPGYKGDPFLYRAARLERSTVREFFRAAVAEALRSDTK